MKKELVIELNLIVGFREIRYRRFSKGIGVSLVMALGLGKFFEVF